MCERAQNSQIPRIPKSMVFFRPKSAGGRSFWAQNWRTSRGIMHVWNPKIPLSVAEIWRSKWQRSSRTRKTTKEMRYNPVASSLSQWRPDPRFSITLISPPCAQNSSGAVPRTPETPRHSPTLRDRPRGALFCIALSPGPLVFFGPFDACVLSVIWMNLCAFGGNRSSRSLCPFGKP